MMFRSSPPWVSGPGKLTLKYRTDLDALGAMRYLLSDLTLLHNSSPPSALRSPFVTFPRLLASLDRQSHLFPLAPNCTCPYIYVDVFEVS